jgi:HEAT repeat protein
MDELERLARAYRVRPMSSVASKLDVLMKLQRVRDSRVVPFLLTVLGDRDEPDHVRAYVVKQLRTNDGLLIATERGPAARAIERVLAGDSSPELRLEAALALGEFIEIDGVLEQLNGVCLASDESIDLRYGAFTSLQRAGPTSECVAMLRRLASDETLGQAALTVLTAWRVGICSLDN